MSILIMLGSYFAIWSGLYIEVVKKVVTLKATAIMNKNFRINVNLQSYTQTRYLYIQHMISSCNGDYNLGSPPGFVYMFAAIPFINSS